MKKCQAAQSRRGPYHCRPTVTLDWPGVVHLICSGAVFGLMATGVLYVAKKDC
jgi:hypothetical protein